MRMNFGKTMLVGLALLCGAGIASAADFPDRPIQFIVPYSAGGATDLWARAIAQVAPRILPRPDRRGEQGGRRGHSRARGRGEVAAGRLHVADGLGVG